MSKRRVLSRVFTRRFLLFLVLSVGLVIGLFQWSTVPVAGSGTSRTVYVSSPSDGKILKVDIDGGVTTTVVHTFEEGEHPGAMTFGPDGNLWVVVDGDEIVKVHPDGSGTEYCHVFTGDGEPESVGDIRFLGDIPYFTTDEGVFRFDDPENCEDLTQVNQEPLALETPAGIFFEIAGRILFLDGGGDGDGILYRDASPFASMPSSLEPFEELDSPIAVGTRGSHGFPDTNDTYVSDGNQIKGFDCFSTGECVPSEAKTIDFGEFESTRDFEVNLAGELLAATQSSEEDDYDPAELWLVTFDKDTQQPNEPELLVDFSDVGEQESINDIWGVAIPPTSYRVTRKFSGSGKQTRRYNCGNSLADLSFDPMGATEYVKIDCRLELPDDVNQGEDGFTGDATGAFCAQYDTSNGFCTVYDVQADHTDDTLLVTYVRKAEPLPATPLMVHDRMDVTIVDYYLQGELDPDDQGRKSGRASEVVVADGPQIEDPAEFHGFSPALGGTCEAPLTIKGNGGIPIRPAFSEPCDDSQELRLSIVCNLAGEGAPLYIDVVSRGNANFENFFRCTVDNQWMYNLDPVGSGIPKNSCCAINAWGSVGATGVGYFKRK